MAFPAGFEHFVRENEPLADFTWLQIGGSAKYFCEPTSLDDLKRVVEACNREQILLRVLGGGSNLLISEEGVDGAVISLDAPAFSSIQVDGHRVTAGGGARLSHLVSISVGAGLMGLESLVGIPGTVGGALRGNAGSSDADIGDRVESVHLMDHSGNMVTKSKTDLTFSHGSSSISEPFILSATFALEPADVRSLTQRMQKLWILKRASQPGGHPRAVAPFNEPDANSVATLIEMAGLRGTAEGLAQFSIEHPNFLIAMPGATSHQVLALVERVRETVYQRCGVQLQSRLAIW